MSSAAAGAKLGPYELLSPIGAGGMGEVWKARDTRLNRIVAIKISPQEFSNRYERETRAIASLNHPNICALYDVGPDYLVMEFVDGAAVQPPGNVRKLLDVAAQIADGMAAAHERGIIHRDLKPDNILVATDGRVKILDFGLAKDENILRQSDTTLSVNPTEPGVVMGTISYMSPEQARGEAVDARSDQFSFGIILYELASGKRPFQKDSAPQTMTAIIEAEPEPLPATVPPPLRWIIDRCLAKEPPARYESTRDLYRELKNLQEHISEVSTGAIAAATSAASAALRWLLLAAAVAALLLLLAGAYLLGTRRAPPVISAASSPLTSSGGFIVNPVFSPDGTEVVYAWNGPRGSNSNLYLKLIGSNDLLRITNNGDDERSPAWSPDGKWIAFVRRGSGGKHAVMLTSPLGGSERKVLDIAVFDWGTEGHSLISWTPDSRALFVADARELALIPINGGERQAIATTPSSMLGFADPAISPDGRRLAVVRRDAPFASRAFWIPLTSAYLSAGPPREVATPGVMAYSPNWVSDDEWLIAAGAPFGMRLYRRSLSGPKTELAAAASVGGSVALHRGKARVVYTALLNLQNLYQVQLDAPGKASQPPQRLTSTTGTDMAPVYSPDAASIAFTSSRLGHYGLWTTKLQATIGSELTSEKDRMIISTDWSPDGTSLLYFSTGTDRLWHVYTLASDTGRVQELVREPFHQIFPSFSRDGHWIYFASNRSGRLELFKVPAAGGTPALVSDSPVVNARESPDGKWLYASDYGGGGLYRAPSQGGQMTRFIDGMLDPLGYVPDANGVYYWTASPHGPVLRYRDSSTARDSLVYAPSLRGVANLTISADGHRLCFPLVERISQELELIENWR